jgi:hypothetical protein
VREPHRGPAAEDEQGEPARAGRGVLGDDDRDADRSVDAGRPREPVTPQPCGPGIRASSTHQYSLPAAARPVRLGGEAGRLRAPVGGSWELGAGTLCAAARRGTGPSAAQRPYPTTAVRAGGSSPGGTLSSGPQGREMTHALARGFSGKFSAPTGPLAQLAEQRTFNPRVVGSIPTGPTLAECPARTSTPGSGGRSGVHLDVRRPAVVGDGGAQVTAHVNSRRGVGGPSPGVMAGVRRWCGRCRRRGERRLRGTGSGCGTNSAPGTR